MRSRFTASILTLVLSLGLGNNASAETGPIQTPLKVTAIYLNDSSRVFVSFNAGAMPGCYKDSGGYLQSTNARFKEIYAQLLMLAANGGMRASVLYTQNPPTNNWGDCYVDGIYLRPD